MLIPMHTHSPCFDLPHYRGRGRALPVAAVASAHPATAGSAEPPATLAYPCAARFALLVMLAAALAACGSQPVRHTVSHPASRLPPIVFVDVPPADPARANDVLIRAIGLVGTPYRWGGNMPEGGFDCSGLVNFVFRDMGRLSLPRTARDLAAMPVPSVRDNRLAPGDLLLFGDRDVNHVGIYVGQGRFVHAPNQGGTVRLDEINGWYWREHYLGARRLLR